MDKCTSCKSNEPLPTAKIFYTILVLIVLATLVFAIYKSREPRVVPETAEKQEITDISGKISYFKTPVDRTIMVRSRDIYEFSAVLENDFAEKIIAWGDDITTADKDAFEKYAEKFPSIKDIPFVGSIFKDALSPENIIAYDPELVIMETFMIKRKYNSVELLEQAGLPVVYLDTSQKPFEDPQKSIKILGQLFEREERAGKIVDFIDSGIAEVNAKLVDKQEAEMPTVYIEAGNTGPLEYGNTYGLGEDHEYSSWGSMVKYAKGKNIIAESQSDMNVINPEYLLETDPDIIIITGANWDAVTDSMRLGYYADPEKSREILKKYLDRPGWSNLKAVKNKRVYAIHHGMTMHIFNFIALEQLAKWFYPEDFSDINPEENFRELHDKFLPIDYSGAWMLNLYEEE